MATLAKKRPAAGGLLLRFRASNTKFGVTRQTAKRLADHFGVDETLLIHLALSDFAARNLPGYEADDGPLSPDALKAVRTRAGAAKRLQVLEDLFEEIEA
jgi:hypothetical protein